MAETYEYNTAPGGTHDELVADDRGCAAQTMKSMVKDLGYCYARITGLAPDGLDATGSVDKHTHDGSTSTDGAPVEGILQSAWPNTNTAGSMTAGSGYMQLWSATISGTSLADNIVSPSISVSPIDGINQYDVWLYLKLDAGSAYVIVKDSETGSAQTLTISNTAYQWHHVTTAITAGTTTTHGINVYVQVKTGDPTVRLGGWVIGLRSNLS